MTAQLATRPTVGVAVALRDGSAVRIRQLTGDDAELLADGFARLSLESRQFRFLTGKPRLSAAELRYFTAIDHHDHEALVALSLVDGRGVGVARYVRYAKDPQTADVAVTVIDEWHGRGLGTELMTRLIDRAVAEGIRRFTASIAADNVAVLRLLRDISVDYVLVGFEDGIVEYEISLPPPRDDAA
jgi:RimJ/RimL family protein N-acetyltransferase